MLIFFCMLNLFISIVIRQQFYNILIFFTILNRYPIKAIIYNILFFHVVIRDNFSCS